MLPLMLVVPICSLAVMFCARTPKTPQHLHFGRPHSSAHCPPSPDLDHPIGHALQVDATYGGYNPLFVFAAPTCPVMRSTGMYLPPGVQATVSVPAYATSAGLQVLVGAHTDNLMPLACWKRIPRITRTFPITAPVTTITSTYGGLVYLQVRAARRTMARMSCIPFPAGLCAVEGPPHTMRGSEGAALAKLSS
jgi:hypothetical protein